MMRCWRPLVWAALLSAGHVTAVAAQTLIVRNAPASTPIEVVYESDVVGKGAPDQANSARIALSLVTGTAERVLQFHVDRCQGVVRIGMAERDRLVPTAGPECDRQELAGLFVIRRVSSMVLDLAPTTPILLIRQGPPPPQWLRGDYTGESPALVQSTGLNLYAGAVLPRFVHSFEHACGDVYPCVAHDFRPSLTFGATYWFPHALGAELSMAKSAGIEIEGSQQDLLFRHELETDIVTMAGNFGGMFGKVRVYARGGYTYQRGTSTLTQRIEDRSYTIDGVEYVLKGGTQQTVVNTAGWGWMFGGGFEMWLKPPFGIYSDVSFGKIKGDDLGGGESDLDERMLLITIGGRWHVGNPFRRSSSSSVPSAPQPAPAPPASAPPTSVPPAPVAPAQP